ncbi:MAG TPA: hypothetical protein VKA26_04160 [Ignavibacteriaceae bacterium]|nr:hypothetical protein [Ignavibacteriaceae bacterium]
MKKFIILLAFTGLFLMGCSDTVMNPVTENAAPEGNEQVTAITAKNTSNTIDKLHELGYLTDFSVAENTSGLSKSSSNGNHSRFSQRSIGLFKNIQGNWGGNLFINQSYKNFKNLDGWVKASITFSKGSFNYSTFVFMIVDPDDGTVTFFPHMNFEGEVTLDAEIDDIDISNLPSSNGNGPQFVYFNDDGTNEVIPAAQVIIDQANNRVIVKGAKLKHFSRYGWAK